MMAGLQGGGSPIKEKIALSKQYDLESKKKLVNMPAGIKD
jgi:hypothetical protein